jgi:hypothetical protein
VVLPNKHDHRSRSACPELDFLRFLLSDVVPYLRAMDVLKNLYLAKGQIDVCRYYISLPSVAWRLALQQRCEAYPDQFICTLDPENFLAMQRSVCGGLAFVNKRIIKEGDPLKINVIDPRKVEKMVEIQVYDCNSMYATGRNLRKWMMCDL